MPDEHLIALGRIVAEQMARFVAAEGNLPDGTTPAEAALSFDFIIGDFAGSWEVAVRRPEQ